MLALGPVLGLNRAHPLNAGLVSWHLAALTGRRGAWRDLIPGTGVTGVLTNGPTWDAQPRAGAPGGIRFVSGSSQIVNCGTSAKLDTLFSSTQSSTLSVLAYVASLPSAWSGIFTKGRDTANFWGLWINDTNHWHLASQNDTDSAATVTAGRWTHLVGTRIGNTTTLYVDGLQDGQDAADTADHSNTSELWIGGAKGVSEYFSGGADDLRAWSRGFPPDEVWRLFVNIRQGYPGLFLRRPLRSAATSGAAAGQAPRSMDQFRRRRVA